MKFSKQDTRYVSEFTKFLTDLKQKDPTLDAKQRDGRSCQNPSANGERPDAVSQRQDADNRSADRASHVGPHQNARGGGGC